MRRLSNPSHFDPITTATSVTPQKQKTIIDDYSKRTRGGKMKKRNKIKQIVDKSLIVKTLLLECKIELLKSIERNLYLNKL